LEVAYFNATEGELRVATRVASAWDRQGIWNEGTSERISLDHGPDARPHVAWVSDEGRLMYAVRSDEGWDVSLVDDGTGVTWVSLAVDGGGVPHMAFRDQEYGGIRYAAGRSM
jgi:hypothetical protein